VERERSGERKGSRPNPTGAERSGERGSKNQVERERSGSERSLEQERSGERAKSAAQNLLHRKTTQSKKLKIEFKSYHKTVSVSPLLLSLLWRE